MKKIKVVFLILSFIFLFFLLKEELLSLKSQTKLLDFHNFQLIEQRTSSLIMEMSVLPHNISDDLIFLTESQSVKNLISQDFSQTSLGNLEHDLLAFVKTNSSYYQLSYLDVSGQELVKVSNNLQQGYKAQDQNELVSLAEEENFLKALNLKPDQILVSEVIPEKVSSWESLPMMNYMIPVFDDNSTLKGLIHLKVNANYFLDDIRRAQRNGEQVFLVDDNGFYLAHADKKKEFGNYLNNPEFNLFKDYPDLPADVLVSGTKNIETGDKIFTFSKYSPEMASYHIYEGSQTLKNESEIEDNFWVLVSVSDKQTLLIDIKNIEFSFYKKTVLILGLVLFLSGLFISMRLDKKNK